jgi:hypothetical protein
LVEALKERRCLVSRRRRRRRRGGVLSLNGWMDGWID